MHRPPIVKINVKLLLKFLKISTQVDNIMLSRLLFDLYTVRLGVIFSPAHHPVLV